MGPMITPGLVVIAMKYMVSVGFVSTFMVGSLAFFTGGMTFFTAAAANIWGKRPMFIYSTAILIITCFWGLWASVCT